MDAARDWSPDYRDLNVRIQKSLRIPVTHRHPLGFEDRGTVIVPFSTRGDLGKLRPDVVISVEVGPRTLQAAILRKFGRGFKLIVQVRESENTAQSRGVVRRALRRVLLPRVDGVFVNGASGARHVLECGVAPARISVVPSGTDTEVFGKRADRSGRHEELRLIYVGQLIARKGLVAFSVELIKAATASKRQILWTLAGRGPLEAPLRALPWPENVRLDFVGSRPYRELPGLYNQADVFVMPSLSDEWGMVVNEAMASGLPIFGCEGVQAVQELVRQGVSGWTYAPEDKDALQRLLREMLDASAEKRAGMGEAARRCAMEVSDEYTAAAMHSGVGKALAGQARSAAGRLTF
jgi:glycosyltransferase involved in cell wall biosynthesis